MYELAFIYDEDHRWITCIELAKRYRRQTAPRSWDLKPAKRKRKRGND